MSESLRPDRRRFLIGSSALALATACSSSSPTPHTDPPSTGRCPAKPTGPGQGYCAVKVAPSVAVAVGAARVKAGEVLLFNIDGDDAIFVARDANGLYAMSAVCTHQCCVLSICGGDAQCLKTIDDPGAQKSTPPAALIARGTAFFCLCHNSEFDASGRVTHGPAITPLAHLSACINGEDVVVDTSLVVPETTRV